MKNTLTLRSMTRWNGAVANVGDVLRVPQDVDLVTARRWVNLGIAKVGGEYVSGNPLEAEGGDEQPFAEIEAAMEDAKKERAEALMERSKDALLEMAADKLLDVDPKIAKEELARILADKDDRLDL